MRKVTTNPRCKISTEYMWYYLVHFICLLVLTLLNIVQGRSRRITKTRWPPTDPHNWTLKTHIQELSGNVVSTKVQKSMWSVGVTMYTFIYLIYYLCAICYSIHFISSCIPDDQCDAIELFTDNKTFFLFHTCTPLDKQPQNSPIFSKSSQTFVAMRLCSLKAVKFNLIC